MGDSIFITEVVIGLIVLWLMPPANGWSMKTSTWPFSYTFCGVLNINDNMASKQKKAGKIFRKNQKKITEQKSRNWTDLETEEFCRVLADPDSDFCLTLEKKALKKPANKEVFETIQEELKIKLQDDEFLKFNQLYSDVGDDSPLSALDISIPKLRNKYNNLKKDWRKRVDRAKNGSGLRVEAEATWFQILHQVMSDAHSTLDDLASQATDTSFVQDQASEDEFRQVQLVHV